MSIKFKRYRNKSQAVGSSIEHCRLIKLTDKNLRSVAEWLEGRKDIKSITTQHETRKGSDEPTLKLRVHVEGLGIRVVRAGDYVGKVEADFHWTLLYSNEKFEDAPLELVK